MTTYESPIMPEEKLVRKAICRKIRSKEIPGIPLKNRTHKLKLCQRVDWEVAPQMVGFFAGKSVWRDGIPLGQTHLSDRSQRWWRRENITRDGLICENLNWSPEFVLAGGGKCQLHPGWW
jgi:hypothetical protein